MNLPSQHPLPCFNEFENALKRARGELRVRVKQILSKLDSDEWKSLIFLIYDEANAFHEGFRTISELSRNQIDKVSDSLLRILNSSQDYETALDPLIEAFYHLGRYDILEDDLKLCMDHSLHQVCQSLSSLYSENLALFQVFSGLTQEQADQFVSLRLKNWHSHHQDEMLEVLFLRNLDPKRKSYLDLISDIYEGLIDQDLHPMASLLQPYVWEKNSISPGGHNTLEGLDITDFYPMPQGEPHGLCIIINVNNFMEAKDAQDDFPLDTRRGSDIDKDLVEGTFKLFGFTIVTLDNPDYEEFCSFFTKLRKDVRLYAMAALAVCVMTHGDKDDNLYLADRKCIYVTDLRKLCYARALIGKPKMFFIQACRGEENLTPILLQRDATITSNTESDCIIAAATVGKHSAMRSQSSGSWYINDLCSTLQEIGHRKPLKTVLNVTRTKLKERMDTFRGMYITQISEDKVTLTKEVQLKRGGESSFIEGILDLTILKIFQELMEFLISEAVDEVNPNIALQEPFYFNSWEES
ncbi:Caspase-8 [Armadillidium nasatum]|uniref:Caspase-8 n=1 Tax=Armadillidium nasatum TaxID=96803 RepID=A0A5N5T3R4_9CRUS|nr:Caspase-8 [Armadillidium nasatum]